MSLNALALVTSVCMFVSVCFALVCVQSALSVAMSSVLRDGHTQLVIELSHGGMGSPFDGCW